MALTVYAPTMAGVQRLPALSLEQRYEALQRANAIRVYRADLKRQIKARRVDLRTVIRDPEPRLESMRVLELLMAAPRIGRVKADKLLRVAEISPSKTLGGMTERQRRKLLDLLNQRVAVARASAR